MSIIGTIYEDVTTDVAGKIGSWQWLVTFISGFLMTSSLFNIYEDIYMLHPRDVLCVLPERSTVINSSMCFITLASEENATNFNVQCSKWHIRLMGFIWLNKSWLVYCEQKFKLMTTPLICHFGFMFGSVSFGLIADSFGRKSAIMIDVFSSFCLGLVITFCDSEAWFRLLLFLKALFGSANLYLGLLLITEISSNSWRSTLSTIVMIPRLVAAVCTAPLANAAPNLETFSFIACMFSMVYIVLLRWCPESPQWLLYNRKIHSAERTLKRAAKMNGIRLCEEFKIRPVNHKAYNCLDETTTCVGVVTTHNIRTIFMVTTTIWSVYYFLWSTIYLRLYAEKRKRELLLQVFCFVVLFGGITIVASMKSNLRHILMTYVTITGAVSISVLFVHNGIGQILLSSIAISTGAIVHALILNVTPRLVAINIRATVFGLCHFAGQLGTTISYIIFLFYPYNDVTWFVVVLCATAILEGLCFILPDVDGRELPDVMEDMDYYSELTKPLRWATQKTNSPSIEEVEMRVYSFGSSRVVPTRSHSETRNPAQQIGFVKLWRTTAGYLVRKLARNK